MKGFQIKAEASDKLKEHMIRWLSWEQGQVFLALSSLYRRDEKDDPRQPGKLSQMCLRENLYH